MTSKGSTIHAIIIKRIKIREHDELVTVLSKEEGKILARAPGVRKLSSSMAAALEPGNFSKLWHIPTKSGGLITQASCLVTCTPDNPDLSYYRALTQFLELLDALFVSEPVEESTFTHILELHELLRTRHTSSLLRTGLGELVQSLGFDDPFKTHPHVTGFVEELVGRKLQAHAVMRVR